MTIEEDLFRIINSLAGQSTLVDHAMIIISSGITWILLAIVISFPSLLLRKEKILAAFFAAILALAVADLVSFQVVKQLVARERPCRLLENVHLVTNSCGGSYGFTSNHAANAFAVWMMVAVNFGLRSYISLVAITLATLVALSRVYLGVHFVGDIVGGAILGIAVATTLNYLGLTSLTRRLSRSLIAYLPSSGK